MPTFWSKGRSVGTQPAAALLIFAITVSMSSQASLSPVAVGAGAFVAARFRTRRGWR